MIMNSEGPRASVKNLAEADRLDDLHLYQYDITNIIFLQLKIGKRLKILAGRLHPHEIKA
jgi:hypothetical protein